MMNRYITRLVDDRDIDVIEKHLIETSTFIDEIITWYNATGKSLRLFRAAYLFILGRQINRKEMLEEARDKVLEILWK